MAAKKDKLLDAVLISHQDSDHVALLPQLAEKMKFLGCTAENMSLGGISWEKVNKTRVTKFAREMDIDEDEIEFNAPYASDYEDVAKRADLGHYISYEDVFIRALVSGLSVTGKADIVKNSSSAIVVVENGSFSAVLPGDATYQTMGAANDISPGGSRPSY